MADIGIGGLLKKNKMKRFIKELNALGKDFLEILNPLLSINEIIIDEQRSSVKKSENLVEIVLKSIDEKSCPIEFLLKKGQKINIEIYLDGTGPIIEDFISEKGDEEHLKDLLYINTDIKDIMSNEITCEEVSVDGKVKKVTYYYFLTFDRKPEKIPYAGGGLGLFSLWKKKKIRHINYKAWL